MHTRLQSAVTVRHRLHGSPSQWPHASQPIHNNKASQFVVDDNDVIVFLTPSTDNVFFENLATRANDTWKTTDPQFIALRPVVAGMAVVITDGALGSANSQPGHSNHSFQRHSSVLASSCDCIRLSAQPGSVVEAGSSITTCADGTEIGHVSTSQPSKLVMARQHPSVIKAMASC